MPDPKAAPKPGKGAETAAGPKAPTSVKAPETGAKIPAKKLTFREKMSRAWRITQLSAWVLLGAAGGYVIATIVARLELQDARRGFVEKQEQLEEKGRGAALRERVLLARRDLHLSLLALEQRNFGTTERLAREAGVALANSGERYAELSELLKSFRPTVSDDIARQRAALLDVVNKLDEMIGPSKAE